MQSEYLSGARLGILIFFGLFVCSLAQATTYYVDQNHPSANDESNNGSIDQPWLTITRAAQTATEGDTVIVKPGTYEERIQPVNSGSAGNRLVFRAEPRRAATMWGFYTYGCDYLTIEGFNITTDDSLTGWTEQRGIFIRSDNVTVLDNHIYGIRSSAITGYWHDPEPSNARIFSNYIYHCQFGINITGADWLVEDNEIERLFSYGAGDCDYSRFFGNNHVIKNNYFHGTNFNEIGSAHVDCFQTFTNNGESSYNILIESNVCYDFHQALMASNVNNTATSHFLLRNNIFARGGAWGLCVYDIPNITAENNTFADIQYHGAGFYGSSTGNVVRNNIFYSISSSYWASDGAVVSGDNNLIYDANSPANPGPNDLIGQDPLFVNPAQNDYHLLPNSPARDAGQILPQVSTDIELVPRPQGAGWDIGAHEFKVQIFEDGFESADVTRWAVAIQ